MVKTNAYSVPLRAGSRVEARVYPLHVEIWHAGRRVARHERCHRRRQHVLDLEHYLDVLSHKPGAFAGSKPLAQWRAAGRWPPCYDELWDRLLARHGKQNGTRAMVAVVALGPGVRPRRAARRDHHGGVARRVRRRGGALSADRGGAAQRPACCRSMSANSPATTGRCRRWRSTTCCCPARARGPHDGRSAGAGHPAALQDAAHADDRRPVRPPGRRRHPRGADPCRLPRGAAGGRDGGAREPGDRASAARGAAAADEDAGRVRVRPLRRRGRRSCGRWPRASMSPRPNRSCWSARLAPARPISRRVCAWPPAASGAGCGSRPRPR